MSATARTGDPQVLASDPACSVFLTANAGSGKTRTLVDRVARLLLRGARPDAVLCVTYTKAAASEMQRRLFERLGAWAVMPDAALRAELTALGEGETVLLPVARALFARALETPGGLKVQTIHAFCERLLRRFPLEAGVSPRFQVLEDAGLAAVTAQAREAVARKALAGEGPVAEAYAHLSVALDLRSFDGLFGCFDAEREAVAAYVERWGGLVGAQADVWDRCGFAAPSSVDALQAEALAGIDRGLWRRAAEVLIARGGKADGDCAAKLLRVLDLIGAGEPAWSEALDALFTSGGEGTPRSLFTKSRALKDAGLCERMGEEQDRLQAARTRFKAALVAVDTVAALTLAMAYQVAYAETKRLGGALDFADLIARTRALLTERADAAWVLYKLDGGIDHILVDEAQDTAPDQWRIVGALAAEFFAGHGIDAPCERTVFAVGDEKQSIYSFQGAQPERLLEETERYRRLTQEAGCRFRDPALVKSWRSAPQVLRFVDAVFDDPAARAGLQPGREDPIRHETVREEAAGSVELWPLIPEPSVDDPDPWRPLDVEAPGSGRKQLAETIAGCIKAAVERGEAVGGKGGARRPVNYGDFLVLVQRRDASFEEVIRACKLQGVPVAGADRLKLSEHIAFQDLLALVRFVLFPDDDLTLATLLRSPFCDVNEDDLYALAQGREGRLWKALRERADERSGWAAARDLLRWAQAQAGRTPFDFLSRTLERADAEGRSNRLRFLTRLGGEAQDALHETLSQALAAEARGILDLESFAAAMAQADVEVKRELEEPRGEVRVMTVHGAKGLEAPIVILPDTTAKPRVDGPALLKTEDGGFLWCGSKKADCEPTEAARQLREQARRDEALRLFYVALTRARDRLILCGRLDRAQSKTGEPAPDSWYALARTALEPADIAPETRDIEASVRRFGPDPQLAGAGPARASAAGQAPDWARRPAAAEARPDFTSPTRMAHAGGGAPSPLAEQGGLGRFRRGELIHKLLELLPDLPPERREADARTYLSKQTGLSEAQRTEIAEAALAVVREPAFAPVFGPGSRAEAALAGAAPGLPPISGRVDRLVVGPDRVLVVDYKTNRTAPASIEAADPAYLDQMAVYTAVLREVFPGRRVEAALLWTDGPRLMPVPEPLVEQRLAALRSAH
ncbi:MAG: double-strand break repair helicase AddA [Proteobacteria bacterium]|nr:double-strand break repair helicase AddA [Pseudomonadota bacterium]